MQASAPLAVANGELPQTDTAATLQMLLGVLALAAAGAVIAVGRRFPPKRPGGEEATP